MTKKERQRVPPRKVQIDGNAVNAAMKAAAQQAAAETPEPPKSVPGNFQVTASAGAHLFENARLQFPTTQEMAGALFVMAAENQGEILGVFAPGMWAEAVRVGEVGPETPMGAEALQDGADPSSVRALQEAEPGQ